MSVSVTYYIGSHGQNGQLFIGARDGHVLFVSGCPILTAVNSFKMDGLYSKYDIWHRLTCGCTDGRGCLRCTQRFYQIFLHPQVSYFFTRGSSAIIMKVIKPAIDKIWAFSSLYSYGCEICTYLRFVFGCYSPLEKVADYQKIELTVLFIFNS